MAALSPPLAYVCLCLYADPKCQQGYDGVGPVCWQQCKPGYIVRPLQAFVLVVVMLLYFLLTPALRRLSLPQDEGALCRKKGSIVTYAKKSYGRGAGHVMTCAAGYQEDAALCYPLCPVRMPTATPFANPTATLTPFGPTL